MRLFLVRHGLASWPAWGGADAERPLNAEGRQMLHAESARLAQLGLRPALILHSPLVRARETAEIIAQALGAAVPVQPSESLRPGFNIQDLKKLLHEQAGCEELMLIGHAPDMAEVVKGLTGGEVKLKEGGVALVRVDEPDKDPAGLLLWLAPAEVLAVA